MMGYPDGEPLMATLFSRLRAELQPYDSIEVSLVDNGAFLSVKVRTKRQPFEDDFPRFRLWIWGGAAGVNLSHRQKGYASGEWQRQLVRLDDPDIEGTVVEIVMRCIGTEKKRMMAYHQR
jgi:hypothetical protein